MNTPDFVKSDLRRLKKKNRTSAASPSPAVGSPSATSPSPSQKQMSYPYFVKSSSAPPLVMEENVEVDVDASVPSSAAHREETDAGRNDRMSGLLDSLDSDGGPGTERLNGSESSNSKDVPLKSCLKKSKSTSIGGVSFGKVYISEYDVEAGSFGDHCCLNGEEDVVKRGSSSTGDKEGLNTSKPSFASILTGNNSPNENQSIHFSELHNEEHVDGASVVLPIDLVKQMQGKFGNMLFGYFLGKRIPFPIVEKYVKNVWTRYGLERVMLKNGFYLFQFSTREGMDSILKNGPWMIKLSPLFLNIWTPDTTLKKEMMTRVPLWVKLFNLPLIACSDVGLSLISSKIGRPIMMDSFTSNMCLNPWGGSKFARVLLEVRSDKELPNSVVVAIPNLDGSSHSLETVTLEYEWLPPRCSTCKVFDHKDDQCPNMIKNEPGHQSESQSDKKKEDEFVEVQSKRNKKKKNKSRQVTGIKLSKPDLQLVYRPVEKEKASTLEPKINGRNGGSSRSTSTDVPLKNGFEGLNKASVYINESDSEDEIILENPDGERKGDDKYTL